MIGGFYLVLAFVFLTHTRLAELVIPGLRLQLILAIGALVLALMSGTVVRALKSRVGVCFLLLTLWFYLGVPFSVNRMASLSYINENWLKSCGLFIMVLALVNTRRELSRLSTTVALGSTVMAVTALVMGPPEQDRLMVDATSLNDPNLLGMTLLIGVPLWMVVIGDRSRFLLSRLIAVLCVVPLVVAIALTGSRGTLVAAVILVGFLMKRFSIGGKVSLVLVVALVAVMSVTYLAENLLERYTTVADPGRIQTTASTESRTYLFKQGLRLVARYPIFGVGLGNFAWAENILAQDQGQRRGAWHTCHNMYIEVASEAGLPAFLVYMAILLTVWKSLGRLEKVTPEEHPKAAQIARLSFWLKVSLLAYCTCGLFLSCGLSHTFVIMISLCVAWTRVVHYEMHQLEQENSEQPVAAASGALVAPALVREL